MKKLKIAMFGHKRIPSREGGVEIVVEQLSTKMVKCGMRLHALIAEGNLCTLKRKNN